MTPHLSLRRYGTAPGSHAHDHVQLLWGWEGILDMEVEGRGCRVGPGDLLLVAPADRHDFHADDASTCFVLDADPACVDGIGWARATTRRVHVAATHLLRALALHPQWLQAPAAADLLLTTLHGGDAGPLPARTGPAPRCIDWGRLDRWIDAHLAHPLDVAGLAAQVHLSASQFTVRCLAETGLAPMTYLRERRLAAARRWRAAGWPVKRVAERCGYRSPSALTAALRRQRR